MTTRVWLYTNAGVLSVSEAYSVEVSRGRSREQDEISPGTLRVRVRNQSGNFNPYFLNLNEFLLTEAGDFLLTEDSRRLVIESSGSSGTYGAMNPGLGIAVTDGSAFDAFTGLSGVPIFIGFIEDIDYDWRPGRFAEATIAAADGLARFARNAFLEWTTTAFQTSGARVSSVIARSEVDDSWLTFTPSIDTGVSTLQSDLVTHGSNVLSYLQLVNRSEQGRLFVSNNGVFTFQDRASVVQGTAVVDFDDAATGAVANEIPFSVVEVMFGSELLYTKVSVDIIGGEAQTADDTTAQANYGIRHLVLSGLLNDTEDEAADMAEYLLNRYKTPEAVVSSIRVPLEKLSTANRATVCAMDIGDTVTLHWTPTSGFGQVVQTLVIEGVGYEKQVDGATWMSFQLSAAPTNDFFILDDATHGVLDTSTLGF